MFAWAKYPKPSRRLSPLTGKPQNLFTSRSTTVFSQPLSVAIYAPGQRVPSSRTLSVELGISRIPVLNAYAQLLAEGYFESRKGAGTFVSESLPESLTICEEKTPPPLQEGSGPRPVRAACFASNQI